MSDLFEDENPPSERAPSPFSGLPGGATEKMREVRSIGRPVGARNKRDVDFERWFFAMGYTDPAQRLAEVVSEDPIVLWAWFVEHSPKPPTLAEIVDLQIKAAGELMPYLHGKKTPDVSISIENLPTLIIAAGTNQLDQAREILGRRALSIGAPLPEEEPSEIKGLEGSE